MEWLFVPIIIAVTYPFAGFFYGCWKDWREEKRIKTYYERERKLLSIKIRDAEPDEIDELKEAYYRTYYNEFIWKYERVARLITKL